MNTIDNMTFFGYDICRDKEGYDIIEGGSYLYTTQGHARRAMINRAQKDSANGKSFYYHLIQETIAIKEIYHLCQEDVDQT